MDHSHATRLHILQGPSAGQTVDLILPNTVIGRDPAQGVDVILASPKISRRHASIRRQGEDWFIQDLGSSNGTVLNGERLGADPAPLQSGDRVELGTEVILEFRIDQVDGGSEQAGQMATRVEGYEVTRLEAEEPEVVAVVEPPQLTVIMAGSEPVSFTLEKDTYLVGRGEGNDIPIESGLVSRRHFRLLRVDGGFSVEPLAEAKNPLYFEGRPLTGNQRLHHNDVLRIGAPDDPAPMVTLVYQSPAEAMERQEAVPVTFGEKSVLQLGRDSTNDVVIDTPTVSRFHAQIERIGQRFRIRDLRSSNGTFVNDQRIEDDVWLQPNDVVRVGQHRFVMGEDALSLYDETGGVRVDAINLNKWVRKDLNILQNISLVFQPREFIVIVGQSGGGKSTLLDAIAGYRPATHGKVLVNNVDVYRNFDVVRDQIGYVPQRDIIHRELTPYQALDYAAQLRMPADTTKDERHKRVMQVLNDLDLAHRRDVPVSGLSGGQQKRVSIGVELLTEPGLFFLDEPTSGLDPGTETALMQLMRRLADQGRTIVLVTHATKNVMLADKVLFLARGGYLTWFGPPDEALAYFDQYRSDRERRTSAMEFDQIYAILEQADRGSPAEWGERYMQTAAYQQYVVEPMYSQHQIAPEQSHIEVPTAPKPIKAQESKKRVSSLRQFSILSRRNLRILSRDRTSLLLMLLAAPLVSMLDVLIAFMVGRNVFDYVDGDGGDIVMSFFLLIIFSMFVGGLSQMREIVKEKEIYKRERLVNLRVIPYVSSKVWVAGMLAIYHATAYITIHYLAYEMPGGAMEFGLMLVSMVFLAMAGMMLGLLTSAIAPSSNAAPMLVILLIMPQIVLSGALVPLPGTVSAPAATRWTFEAFMSITGVGSDVARDVCWALPEDLRKAMTLEERTNRCNCMGLNVLDQESCNFPGNGQFYDEVIEQERPIEPPPLREAPPEPEIPPAPEQPADQSDSVAMAEYFEALQAYQDEVDAIQQAYKADVEAYQGEAAVFESAMVAYQESLFEWQAKRGAAVGPAEGTIEVFYTDFGWSYVDKNDTSAFYTKILRAWGAQGLMIVVMIGAVLYLVKRKDVI